MRFSYHKTNFLEGCTRFNNPKNLLVKVLLRFNHLKIYFAEVALILVLKINCAALPRVTTKCLAPISPICPPMLIGCYEPRIMFKGSFHWVTSTLVEDTRLNLLDWMLQSLDYRETNLVLNLLVLQRSYILKQFNFENTFAHTF